MADLLLRTVHGSHLYGLNHNGSDSDFYEVYSGKGRAKQTIVGDTDTLRISFDSFMFQCRKGVPQALEALYSPVKEVDKFPFITDTFNPTCAEVYKTYIRTINNFWATGETKRKRHAVRLSLNLYDIMKYGRFNPRTTLMQRDLIYKLSLIETDQCPGLEPSILGIELYTW